MNNQANDLVSMGKTFAHHDQRAEWLIWQLALALEEALQELNELKQRDN